MVVRKLIVHSIAVCLLMSQCGCSSSGRRARELASAGKDSPLLELVQASPDCVNSVDGLGRQALHYAATVGVARLLCEHGADPNAPDKGGYTPLFTAASPCVAAYLLEAGADPNRRDRSPFYHTPLHIFVNNANNREVIGRDRSVEERVELVRILVKGGADINAPTAIGGNPLDFALPEELQSVIREYGGEKCDYDAFYRSK